MMNKAEIVPANHVAIYEKFTDYPVNKAIQNLGFAAMHAAFRCTVQYVGDTEAVISEHTDAHKSLILAPNHHRNEDTPTLASMVYEPPFKSLKGKTIIPAKAELFKNPLTRWFIPHMMAHPAFRAKDFAGLEYEQELRAQTRDALLKINIDHIDNGGSIGLFPESTRNRLDPRVIQPLRRGIAEIARNVDDPDSVLIVPMGFWYKKTVGKGVLRLKPYVVVEEPFSPLFMTKDEVLQKTHSRIQSATLQAHDIVQAVLEL